MNRFDVVRGGVMSVLVAVTGASGTIYARQLLERLAAAGTGSGADAGTGADAGSGAAEGGVSLSAGVVRKGYGGRAVERVGLIVSRRGAEVAAWEGVMLPDGSSDAADPFRGVRVERFDNDDMFASPASGSAAWDAMVIVPASMGCVGRVAAGVSGDLIARAADVTLKEGRPLIVVPRETPLNLIHLRNLTALAEAGAVILPASPGFYSRPADIASLCATVTDRILARLGVGHGGYRWGEERQGLPFSL